MRAGLMTSTVMLTIVGAAVLLGAPRPASTPAEAGFREEATDRVKSGGLKVMGAIGSGMFSARVTPASVGPRLTMDLTGLIGGTEECLSALLAGCNETGQRVGVLSLNDFDIKVKPVLDNDPDFDDRPGGLTGMACTGSPSSTAIVHFTYWTDGQGHWGMNVNPRYHAHGATVVRQDRTTWVVTASAEVTGTPPDTGSAELVSFAHSNIQRKAGPSHEGRHALPFHMTITASSATCP